MLVRWQESTLTNYANREYLDISTSPGTSENPQGRPRRLLLRPGAALCAQMHPGAFAGKVRARSSRMAGRAFHT